MCWRRWPVLPNGSVASPMIERRTAGAKCGSRPDRSSRIGETIVDSLFQAPAESQAGRDRCRQSAAGAVSVSDRVLRRLPYPFALVGHEDVLDLRRVEVPSLDQDGPATESKDGFASAAHRTRVVDGESGERPRLVEIWRDQVGQWKEAFLERTDGGSIEESGDTMTGSETVCLMFALSSAAATASMTPESASMPVLQATGRRSSTTASICAVIRAGSTGPTDRTSRVF